MCVVVYGTLLEVKAGDHQQTIISNEKKHPACLRDFVKEQEYFGYFTDIIQKLFHQISTFKENSLLDPLEGNEWKATKRLEDGFLFSREQPELWMKRDGLIFVSKWLS